MRFKDLKIGTKQIIGFGFILFVMAAVNIFSIHRLASLKSDIDEFNYNWLPRSIAISGINLSMSDLRRNQLQYAFVDDQETRQELAGLMINHIDEINDNLDRFAQLKYESGGQGAFFEEEQNLFKTFDQNWETYQDLSFTFFKMSREKKDEQAITLINGQAKTVFNAIAADLIRLVDIYQNQVFEDARLAGITFSTTRRVNIALLSITIILSILFAVWLVRWITIPLRKLEQAANTIEEGNFDVKIKIVSKDELGRLARAFNKMAISLREAKEKTEEQASRLKMQWGVLRETNDELETKSVSLQKKNSELEQAMQRLKSTQSQLIDSEKMASLGQLTAGIAHEINNPINYITAGISPLRRNISDLKELFHKYKELHSSDIQSALLKEIEELAEQIEVDYLFEEISALLKGMEEGTSRTREIISGLRTFSRLDEDSVKSIDIHSGIDSTLMLLRTKIKNRITVQKEYGQLPPIECLPGKMNQVFMNILNNATQAISDQGTITIKTWAEDEHVKISIKDDGAGMSPEVRSRIFEPFYTTKDVGQGTGLGLSISYGIIEKHGGKLTVSSEEGQGSEFLISVPIEFPADQLNNG